MFGAGHFHNVVMFGSNISEGMIQRSRRVNVLLSHMTCLLLLLAGAVQAGSVNEIRQPPSPVQPSTARTIVLEDDTMLLATESRSIESSSARVQAPVGDARLLTLETLPSERRAAIPARLRQRNMLCAFTFMHGGQIDNGCGRSLQCLREAMPSNVHYDHIAFHEGNLAADVHLRLSSTM